MSRLLSLTVLSACLVSFAASAQTPPAAADTPTSAAIITAPNPAAAAPGAVIPGTTINPNAPVTRAELPELVKEAILANPEIIMQAAQKLRSKQMADSQKDAQDALSKHKAELFDDNVSPSAGDKSADVTLVEFFDYHCGYCKHVLPSVTQLLQDDKKLRIIFREFPILSDDSVTASRAALAVNRIAPDKYFAFHTALMKSNGKFDEKTIGDIAKKLGLSPDKIKAEMPKQEITDQLDKNRALAETLAIRGTPAIVTPYQVIPGAIPYEDLKKLVDADRQGKPMPLDAGPQG